MADYIVKDTELTSVANAIRTAGGTSSLLTFPNGFANAINNISGGGGSSDFSTAQVTYESNQLLASSIACFDETMGVIPFIPQSGTYNVVLYKGKAMGRPPAEYGNIETSGGVSFDPEYGGIFTITGDCTITIS